MLVSTDEQFDIVYGELKRRCLDSKAFIYMLCAPDPDAIAAALILETIFSSESLTYSFFFISSLAELHPPAGTAPPLDLSAPAVFILFGLGATDPLPDVFVEGLHWVVVLDPSRPIHYANVDAGPRFAVCLVDPETADFDAKSCGYGLPASFAAHALVRNSRRAEAIWFAAVGAASAFVQGRLSAATYNALLLEIQREAMACGGGSKGNASSLTPSFSRCVLHPGEMAPVPLLQWLPPAVTVRTVPRLVRRFGLLRPTRAPLGASPTADTAAEIVAAGPSKEVARVEERGGREGVEGLEGDDLSPRAPSVAVSEGDGGGVNPNLSRARTADTSQQVRSDGDEAVSSAARPSAVVSCEGSANVNFKGGRARVEDPWVFLAKAGLSAQHQGCALHEAPKHIAASFEKELFAAASEEGEWVPTKVLVRVEGYGVSMTSLDAAVALVSAIDSCYATMITNVGGSVWDEKAFSQLLSTSRQLLRPLSSEKRSATVSMGARLLRGVSETLVDLLPTVAASFNGAFRTCVIPDSGATAGARPFVSESGLRVAARLIHEALHSRIAAPLLVATPISAHCVSSTLAQELPSEGAESRGYLVLAYVGPDVAPSVTPAATRGRRLRKAQAAFGVSIWGVRNWFADAVYTVAVDGHAVCVSSDNCVVYVPETTSVGDYLCRRGNADPLGLLCLSGVGVGVGVGTHLFLPLTAVGHSSLNAF